MYAKWFRKEIEIEETIPKSAESNADRRCISDFLKKQGYRDVSETDTTITGVRGRKFWNLVNIGDPRRNYHSISISLSHDPLAVRIIVDAWFGLGTAHDMAVFVAEVVMLKGILKTGHFESGLLAEAQAKRRKSDLQTFLLLVGVAVSVCILLVALHAMRIIK